MTSPEPVKKPMNTKTGPSSKAPPAKQEGGLPRWLILAGVGVVGLAALVVAAAGILVVLLLVVGVPWNGKSKVEPIAQAKPDDDAKPKDKEPDPPLEEPVIVKPAIEQPVTPPPGTDPKLPPPPSEEGFVLLFNGKDMTGWKSITKPTAWRVENGNLTFPNSNLSPEVRKVATEKALPRDFHLRMELRLEGTASPSLRLRQAPDQLGNGPRVFISHSKNGIMGAQILTPSNLKKVPGRKKTDIKSGDWFTFEIIAVGSRLTAKMNGTTTMETVDDYRTTPGHVTLDMLGTGKIEIRKIIVKELEAPPINSDAFLPIFNGKDLTGWYPNAKKPTWRVVDGNLISNPTIGKSRSWLDTDRQYSPNFHARMEVRVHDKGDFRFQFRNPPGEAFGYAATIVYLGDKLEGGRLEQMTSPTSTAVMSRLTEPSIKLGQWVILEVIATSDRIEVRINGKKTVQHPDNRPAAPSRLTVAYTRTSNVELRMLEIKEFPQ